MAKGDATTTPPYALGFTVGSTISEEGKFLAYVARGRRFNTPPWSPNEQAVGGTLRPGRPVESGSQLRRKHMEKRDRSGYARRKGLRLEGLRNESQ